MSSISISAVSLSLGGNRVLEDVHLEVRTGEWLGLIGPNGAGKTSLLNAVAGLIPVEGEVLVGAKPLSSMNGRERARTFAVVQQAPVIPTGLSAIDYVMLGRTPHLGYFQREGTLDLGVVRSAMARLEIASLAGRKLESMSGGELQRVVLARALAQEAPVLLLDEPTSALDVGHKVGALEQVEHLRHTLGLTVITVLHDLTLAAQFCDRLALMSGGRIVALGSAAEVLSEGAIRRYYGADVTVMEGPDGSVVVVPMRRSHESDPRDISPTHPGLSMSQEAVNRPENG
jgi:iron complex transport system ATP-binding protein